jgi:tetratricopeptide (TPR) repeat protein
MRRFILPAVCVLTAATAFAQAPAPAPAPTAGKKVTNGFGPKSKGEQKAVQDLLQGQTPDDKIKAADALVTAFPMTDYKPFALEIEAEAYQQKGDNTKAIVYAEQALMADPKWFDADNLLANVIAATTRDTDLDKDDKLAKAEKYAHDSLDTLATIAKPPLWGNLTDDQWTKLKAGSEASAYQALGMIALVRKKNDDAIASFEKGLAASPDPLLMIRLGRVYMAEKKNDEAITWYDKVINSADAPAQYKTIAQSDKARAVQAKGTSAAK